MTNKIDIASNFFDYCDKNKKVEYLDAINIMGEANHTLIDYIKYLEDRLNDKAA